MNQVLSIVRKDLRHFSGILILWTAFLVLHTVFWYLALDDPTSYLARVGSLSAVVSGGQFLLAVGVVAVLMLADPVYGEGAYWRTRPVHWLAVFGAKLLALVVYVAGASGLSTVGLILALRLGWMEAARAGGGIFLIVLLLGFGAAIAGSLSRNRAIFCAVWVLAALGVIASLVVADLFGWDAWFRREPTGWSDIRTLLALSLFLGGGLGLMAWQFRYRRTGLSATALGMLLVACLAVLTYGSPRTPSPEREEPALAESNLVVRLSGFADRDPEQGHFYRHALPDSTSGSSGRRADSPPVRTAVVVAEGLERNEIAVVHRLGNLSYPSWYSLSDALGTIVGTSGVPILAEALGTEVAWRDLRNDVRYQVSDLAHDSFGGIDATVALWKLGEPLFYPLREDFVVRPSSRIMIRRATRKDGNVAIAVRRLEKERVAADREGWSAEDRFILILHNRSLNEALMLSTHHSSENEYLFQRHAGVQSTARIFSFSARPSYNWTISAEWLSQSELVCIPILGMELVRASVKFEADPTP